MKTKVLNARVPKKTLLALGAAVLIAPIATTTVHSVSLAKASSIIYDMSQYQGYITYSEARELKRECPFIILKAQNGGLRTDPVFNHNVRILNEVHMPYGVYDYSLYANVPQARAEAKALLNRAPKAKFYVNDCEENDAGYALSRATYTWAKTIRQNTNRPAVLYSGAAFMSENIADYARNEYNAIWVASYGLEPNPRFHYDLWQFTDDYYSKALGQSLDASTFPDGNNKPLQFWIGGNGSAKPRNTNGKHSHTAKRSSITPLNDDSKNALKSALRASQAKYNREVRKYRSMKAQAKKFAKKAGTEQQQIQAYRNTIKHQSAVINNNKVTINNDNKKLAQANAEIARLKGESNKPGQAYRAKPQVPSQANKPSQRARARRANRKVRSNRIDPGYYHYSGIHDLMVTKPGGISLYTTSGRYIGHVRKGMVLYVDHFKVVNHNGHKTTEAIGIHFGDGDDGNEDEFTSNKKFVRWY